MWARSEAEFISKLESATQELDESAFWLELLMETRTADAETLQPILTDCDELIRIFVTIARRTKGG